MGNSGSFQRTVQAWSPENTEDGYIDADGRFRVYAPQYYRSYKDGYCLRALLHFEVFNGPVPKGYDVHHKNHNRSDDSPGNLALIGHVAHSKLHNPITVEMLSRTCVVCGESFKLKKWRLNDTQRKGLYCSHKCFYARGKNYG